MAVDLRLNRFVRHPPPQETDFQRLERRARERTYLVLFVHDRALSMQCNKQWMLPECDLVRNADNWHERNETGAIRPEDVIIAAFVSLRRIAVRFLPFHSNHNSLLSLQAETEDIFHASKNSNGNNNADINYELVLTNCNNRLTQWDNHFQEEIKKGVKTCHRSCYALLSEHAANGGETFHRYFLTFFRLYVRIFLNSFAIQSSMPFVSATFEISTWLLLMAFQGNSRSPNLYALSACTSSALECLRIASEEFREIHMLVCIAQLFTTRL